ncbi:hypothetical protein CI109_102790 [Kwoniella shandongensis]|uniref:Calpain catalytic domain-containing protein n=1 Tax=Kwoniella shandongensis TaxID=1734106 RepID=A0A5M6BUZ7_9TREE|nr:uncharacterized protein CI109_004889 [Kwoniella shandongensis]KAA5526686.1 hypothetical protein CI109_004889 [Kwoniella shandongensis]
MILLIPVLLGYLSLASAAPALESHPTSSQTVDLVRRDLYTGLWNESGPDVRDIKQVTVLDCWNDASTLAVLISSKDWIEHLFHYGNGAPMYNVSWPQDVQVQVTLWNPSNLTSGPTTQLATVYNKSRTEDHPDGNWWHDAISQAILSLGSNQSPPIEGILANGTFDPLNGSSKIGLEMLTGYEAVGSLRSNYTDTEAFYNDLAKANTGTPVVFNTLSQDDIVPSTPMMGYDHDYAVYNVTDLGNGTRMVWTRNSWGSTDGFDFKVVWQNTYQIIHLKDWNVLEWPGHQ